MLLISEALHQGSGQTSIIPPTLPTNSGAAASGTVKKQGVRSREFQPEEWVAIGLARECIAATYEHAALQAQMQKNFNHIMTALARRANPSWFDEYHRGNSSVAALAKLPEHRSTRYFGCGMDNAPWSPRCETEISS